MSKWVHRISGIDEETQTATCRECGPTSIMWRASLNGWRCAQAVRLQKGSRDSTGGRHGLARAEYLALLEKQSGACAICRRDDAPLTVDHDHNCCPGRFGCSACTRGLLCYGCNTAMGQFKDDKQRLLRAVAYLNRYAPAYVTP